MADEAGKIVLDEKALAEIGDAKANKDAKPEEVVGAIDKIVSGEAGTTPAATDPAPDKPDGLALLQKQLADLQTQAAADKAAREAADRRSADQAKELERFRVEATKSKAEVGDARYQAILNAIDAVKRDADIAKRDWAANMAAGNFDGAAEAQENQARAAARMEQLEANRLDHEETVRVDREQVQQPTQAQPQQQPQGQQLSQKAQAYLSLHPDYIQNPILNQRMIGAHYLALSESIAPDTDAYFSYIDRQMNPQRETTKPVSQTPPAAPPSRSGSGSDFSSGEVRLSPAEREAAHVSYSHLPAAEAELRYAKELVKAVTVGEITRH